jgi:hypothetical protein
MPPPFNINESSPAASALISSFPADEQANRAEIEEWLAFISDPATGLIREEVLPPASASPIPSGSKVLFVQTAAPTGWTKDVTHNNKALRIVNGTASSGGTATFSSVFTSRTPTGSNAATTQGGTIGDTTATGSISNTTATGSISSTTAGGTIGGTALTVANLPGHTHSFSDTATTTSAGSHSHVRNYRDSGVGGGTVNVVVAETSSDGQSATGMDANGDHTHSVTVSGTTGSAGSGTTHTHSFSGTSHTHTFTGTSHGHTFTGVAHNHTFTGSSHNHTWTGVAMDFAVAYVDVIIATKD